MPTSTKLAPWPYPQWIAHRGAGKLAPENTMSAFRVGAAHGYRMFECDVKLSADGVPFLLHDSTLERTTNGGAEIAGNLPWSALAQLDAGSWHSRNFAGESIATLKGLASFCRQNGYFINLEIKPSPGTDEATGKAVAEHADALWSGSAVPPLLSSFEVPALFAAKAARPHLPRALLLDQKTDDWLETARDLECMAIVCNYRLWNASTVAQAKDAGFRTLSYTVNDVDAARHLIELGTDGIITDRVDLFSPAL